MNGATEIEYGPFWDGYVAAVSRGECSRQSLAEDSINMGVDPYTGAAVKRPGSTIIGDVLPTTVGLLESKWGARPRQLFELRSESLAQPTHALLYTDLADVEGQIYFRGTSNMVVGKSYGSTHRSNTAGTVWNLQVQPLFTEHATQIFTRLKDQLSRRVLAPGADRVITVGKRVYVYPRKGTPFVWNGRFNESTTLGTEKERVRLMGPLPPVFPIRATATTVSGGSGPFLGKHACMYSYVGRRADGSFTAPFYGSIPVTGGAGALANGNGYFRVDTNAAHAAWVAPSIVLTVPIMGPDIVERIILRTDMVDTTLGQVPDPLTVKICGVLLNNTQTTYVDTIGDAGLRENPGVIRWNYIMPPRAAAGPWKMDGRVVLADLSPNPAAIVLAPYFAEGSYLDAYTSDEVGAYASKRYYFRISATDLKLKHDVGAAAVTDATITLAGKTLYQVIDEIHTTTLTGSNYVWRAQLAPGVDGNALAADLQPTDGADYFDDDTACADGTTGNCRVIAGQSLPGTLYFKATADFITKGRAQDAVHFSIANPAGTDTEADPPLAAESFIGGYDCRRTLEAGLGRPLGGGSLLDGSLTIHVHGLGVIRNIRGGKTGIDTDYRHEEWKGSNGGVCKLGIAQGDGWVVYITANGLMVNDGRREECISWRVWARRGKRKESRGPWKYEIQQCLTGLANDDDSGRFHVSVADGCIWVCYRSSAAVSSPNRVMCYDYSASRSQTGVEQVLRPDGTPFPWSSPWALNASVIGRVLRNDGASHVYAAVETSSAGYTTGDGRVDEIDIEGLPQDNSVNYTANLFLLTDTLGLTRQKKRAVAWTLEYIDDGGNAKVFATTQYNRGNLTQLAALAVSGASDVYTERRGRLPPQLRSPTDLFEFKIVENGDASRFEVRTLKVSVQVNETPHK